MRFESGRRGILRSAEIASMSAVMALSLAACGSVSQPQQQTTTQETTEQEAQTQEAATDSAQMEAERATAKLFIDAYDARPGVTPLEIGDAFDPQDDLSPYHRDTYEQDAFKGAYGVRCTSGSVTADVISFKNGDGYGIAVTATGPKQDINGFYRDVITVLDPNVDQQNVSMAINDAAIGAGDGKVDGTTLAQTALNVSGDSAAMTILCADYSGTPTEPVETEAEESQGDNGYVDAIAAVRAYGEAMHPYGFKLHSTLGVESAVQPDPSEWVFQIKCDVTNEYGATAKDQTCSAFVDLVDGTWQVSAFSVD